MHDVRRKKYAVITIIRDRPVDLVCSNGTCEIKMIVGSHGPWDRVKRGTPPGDRLCTRYGDTELKWNRRGRHPCFKLDLKLVRAKGHDHRRRGCPARACAGSEQHKKECVEENILARHLWNDRWRCGRGCSSGCGCSCGRWHGRHRNTARWPWCACWPRRGSRRRCICGCEGWG